MIPAIINALLYISLLLFYWNKNKKIDECFLLLFLWALTSVLGFFLYQAAPRDWKLTIWPFLYLFGVFILFVRFLINKRSVFKIERFIGTHSFFLDVLSVVYIVCAIYELINIDLAVLSFSYLSEEAQELYLAAHEETEIVKGPLFYCQRFTSSFFVLAVISVFNYLSQGRRLIGFALFAFTFLSTIAGNAAIASRGAMFSQMLIIVCVFLLYKNHLNEKIKKSIYIGGSIAGGIIAAFFIAITTARFSGGNIAGYEKGPFYSIISYFGHSMLTFDYGICDVPFRTWGGARTFNYFSKLLLGIDYQNMPDLGTHYGTGFTTFIGMLVQDFGYIGTIIFGLIVSWVMYKLWSGRNSLTFAGIYIYVFYLNRMLMGVFVTPPGSDYAYAWAFVTYLLLRLLVKPLSKKVMVKTI